MESTSNTMIKPTYYVDYDRVNDRTDCCVVWNPSETQHVAYDRLEAEIVAGRTMVGVRR